MPLIATRGAASAQGFGEFAQSGPAIYIEDVFSTYLYTGNGSTQTITNNIDLSTKGGLVWSKIRTSTFGHVLIDTVRGGTGNCVLQSNNTNAASAGNQTNIITPFNSNGYTIATDWAELNSGTAGRNYVSWTFRKAKKFFDVVTYTGNGNNNRAISHNLGSAPGCVIIKSTSNAQNWPVFHRSTGANTIFWLNATNANTSNTGYFPTAPDSTSFYVGTDTDVNQNGYTYVAYLFAHDAGGFGLTGSDNVITCGSYTTDGSGKATINLGYEPQWLLVKGSSFASNWFIVDTMRGLDATSLIKPLYANSSAAEDTDNSLGITSTGFTATTGSSLTFIYIAIRRGPMKTPTSGTSVYTPVLYTGNDATPRTITGANFPVDAVITSNRDTAGWDHSVADRLRGGGSAAIMRTNSTIAEGTNQWGAVSSFAFMDGVSVVTGSSGDNNVNDSASTYVNYFFRRAPGFFDVVCYTGTGSGPRWIDHNLTTAPQFIIVKSRSNAESWTCSVPAIGQDKVVYINLNTAASTDATMFPSAPTSTQFRVANGGGNTNANGYTYVAYLFASCPGVSKVGSYTGTGTTLQVNCGFTGGSRFVLIKRTDSTGDWYVWDSARGIVAGNDPYLLLNSTAAEVTNTDYVDTYSAGFEISSTAPAAINANGGTFIFLAIA